MATAGMAKAVVVEEVTSTSRTGPRTPTAVAAVLTMARPDWCVPKTEATALNPTPKEA